MTWCTAPGRSSRVGRAMGRLRLPPSAAKRRWVTPDSEALDARGPWLRRDCPRLHLLAARQHGADGKKVPDPRYSVHRGAAARGGLAGGAGAGGPVDGGLAAGLEQEDAPEALGLVFALRGIGLFGVEGDVDDDGVREPALLARIPLLAAQVLARLDLAGAVEV